MKANNNQIKLSTKSLVIQRLFSLFVFGLLTFPSLNTGAQSWEINPLTPVRGEDISFERYKSMYNNSILYCNSKYNEEEVRKAYPTIDPLSDESLRVYIDSHDNFIQTVKTVFPDNRIKQLNEERSRVTVLFLVNQEGNVLLVSFSLDSLSSIRPLELELLEKKILTNLNFVPYEVNVKGNKSTFVHFQFTFKEILDGYIKVLKQNETGYTNFLEGKRKW
jgi:hypothetical protein